MPEANELCTCKGADHPIGGCAKRATAIDGLCDGCRAAMELSIEPTRGRLLGRFLKLFS